jgi:hypothetical protein
MISDLTKGTATNRFHRSIVSWKKNHLPAQPFRNPKDGLILILDGIWFRFNKERWVCYIVLTRTVKGKMARLRGLVLLKGDESEANWREALRQSLTNREMAQVKALIADGAHGLTAISRYYDWKYGRCHFHLIKDLQKIGGRKKRNKTSKLRQKALLLVHTILDTPNEQETKKLLLQLRRLIARSDCPKTVRTKVSGFFKTLSQV